MKSLEQVQKNCWRLRLQILQAIPHSVHRWQSHPPFLNRSSVLNINDLKTTSFSTTLLFANLQKPRRSYIRLLYFVHWDIAIIITWFPNHLQPKDEHLFPVARTCTALATSPHSLTLLLFYSPVLQNCPRVPKLCFIARCNILPQVSANSFWRCPSRVSSSMRHIDIVAIRGSTHESNTITSSSAYSSPSITPLGSNPTHSWRTSNKLPISDHLLISHTNLYICPESFFLFSTLVLLLAASHLPICSSKTSSATRHPCMCTTTKGPIHPSSLPSSGNRFWILDFHFLKGHIYCCIWITLTKETVVPKQFKYAVLSASFLILHTSHSDCFK